MTSAKATKRVRLTREMVMVTRVQRRLQPWQTATKIACECTTQQSAKAMETTRAATTRTVKARAKVRSRVWD
jgi:hypothetical protein